MPQPTMEAGGEFRALPGSEADVASAWWHQFDDGELARLVDMALVRSPALRGADFSIAEADALLRLASLGRSPSTSSSAGATYARAAAASAANAGADAEWRGTAGFGASWELDYAGRIGALIRAAAADRDAARELRRDLATAIAAETALAYIDLRTAQARISVTEASRKAQGESLALVQRLLEAGRVSRLDLERAEAQYRATAADLPVFEAARANAEARLAALTGQSASIARFESLAAGRAAIPVLRGSLVSGSPEAMLRRRPDVRIAEARLAGALALSDAARADLFPRLTLNASLSALFTDADGLDFSDRLGGSLGPAISWAGPDLRRVRANIAARDAVAGRLVANYEQAVLDALADAETQLSAYVSETQRTEDLEAALASARRARDLARLRYAQGLDSQLSTLDAERTLLDAEDRIVVHRAELARRAVTAWRSLGGMWTNEVLAQRRQIRFEAGLDRN